MDFGKLLSVAQQNEIKAKKKTVPCYQTKLAPPKKETKQSRALSENIKNFLAKKEQEEIQKKLEEKKRKENLQNLRDQRTQNRINKHLKVCKSANKSVLADAVDNENTAITMAGPSQPDEDDYGYVSQEASEFYNKLMEKYNKMPAEKPLFSENGKKTVKDISSTKDRVKQALKQQEQDDISNHRRRKKSGKDLSTDKERNEPEDREPFNKEKERNDKDSKVKVKKKAAPPPIDFVTLLKIAEKKQHEPIMVEVKPKPEEERLMTKKQQREFQKEKESRDRRERQRLGLEVPKPANTEVKAEKVKVPTVPKIAKANLDKNGTDKIRKEERPMKKSTLEKVDKGTKSSANLLKEKEREKNKIKDEILEERKRLDAEKKKLEDMRRELEEEKRKLMMSKNKSKVDESSRSKVVKSAREPIRSAAPSKAALKDIRPREFPPPDVRPAKRPEMKKKNKRRIESDDEYDSELDDFIVHEDDAPEDYSKYISQIFNYDKRKYIQYDDDDDDAMESNFAQQLKEEFVSTKIGLMEDLEDIRREKMIEARKKKFMANKKMRK